MTDEEKIESVREALKKAEAIISIWTNAQKAITKNPCCAIAIIAQAEVESHAVANSVEVGGKIQSNDTYIIGEAQNTTVHIGDIASKFKRGGVKVVIKNDDDS